MVADTNVLNLPVFAHFMQAQSYGHIGRRNGILQI